MFIDTLTLSLYAGKGGDGVVSWRREKYIPKGGPFGGDGGNGGSITIEVDENIFSLEDLRNKRIIKAKNGVNGGTRNKKGKNGKDLIIKVPPGTLIKDHKTKKILFDLKDNKESIIICQGGFGGKGNTHFRTSTNQAPNKCTKGTFGEEITINLELKLIADVGLVGFPNSGKSTLISNICKIKVKIAPYPFTTLFPNLGIIEFDDFSRILIADIPGIIKGAHINKGLGFSFLKHIERTSTLVYIIDLSGIDNRDPFEDFLTLQKELKAYKKELTKKPFLVALNKIDTKEASLHLENFKKNYPYDKSTLFEISALKNDGIDNFLKYLKEISQKDGKKF